MEKAVVMRPICSMLEAPDPVRDLVDEALFGMVLEILEVRDGWMRVRTPYRYEGWAQARDLVTDPALVSAWAALPKRAVLHKSFCAVQSKAAFQSPTLLTLPLGAQVAPVGAPADGWQAVRLPEGGTGYVRASILGEVLTAAPDLPEEELRARLVETAMAYWGTPYRWGGKTPLGIDCSGMTSMAYLLNGIVIWRDAEIQPGFPIRQIPFEQAKAGDLLYFTGHVAMYLGDRRYLHSTGDEQGDGVSINSLDPAAADYREDLAKDLLAVGTYF